MTDKPLTTKNEQELRDEIERLNKIIKALMDKAEQDMNTPKTEFGVFQDTIILEEKIRTRTKELEMALQTNAKMTRALQEAKKQVESSEHYLHDITSALGEGIIVMNNDALIEFVNEAACTMLGYTEAEMLGKNSHDLFHHSYHNKTPHPIELCSNLKVIRTQQPYLSDDDYYWRKDGTCFPVSIITTPIRLKGNTTGAVVAFHDISQSIQERNRLREMQSAIEQSPASVLIFDKNRTIVYVNPQVTQATGYTKEELYGKKTSIFHGDLTPENVYTELWQTIQSGTPWNGELLYYRKDGSRFWQSWNIAPVFDEHGAIQHFVSVGEDITEKKKLHSLLQEMSYMDGLTGIANRRRLDDFLQDEWNRACRYKKHLTIIMTDIDFFKRYNDSLGHLAGDDALKRVAQALKNTIRRSTDLIARYGGEEFACILPDTDMEGAKLMAEALQNAVCELRLPHPDSDISEYVTISLGLVSSIPEQGAPMNLLDLADKALYRAKILGRNRVEVIAPTELK
ncbi:sensory box (GGDEF/EAL domain) regulatory protein [Legionella moravica]|uniref:Sensory box (GGDEF/EAL domain) regulatory protein n=1 Tax=Legionella moravica TaxID=39962 RepID=A0A378JS59_9GAMM|nr:diguanylate cyclase [Legionella moravica]KTD32637.1 sensory box (GGDEF/EAL domain) regulatory protein [Legionella moravica]STX61463.1 sensory box (GGDEF/EAL domain) regulatory protein [Legionella moravica]